MAPTGHEGVHVGARVSTHNIDEGPPDDSRCDRVDCRCARPGVRSVVALTSATVRRTRSSTRTPHEHWRTFLRRGERRIGCRVAALRCDRSGVEAFLKCGIPAHGFLRVVCDECRENRLVAFSCKRRGFVKFLPGSTHV